MGDSMSGLTNSQTSLLKHKEDDELSKWDKVILRQIWYSSSMQAYIQRNTSFDDTMFCKKTESYVPMVDSLTLAMLYNLFSLDAISHVTGDSKKDELEQILLREYEKKEEILLLGNQKYKESVLFAFNERLRNAFAHGTFNVLEDGTALFVGQAKAKQESPLNFYLRIKNAAYIEKWQSYFAKLPINLVTFAVKVYQMYHGLQSTKTVNLYLRDDGMYVYFDERFRFVKVKDGTDNQDAQLKNRIEQLKICDPIGNDTTVFYFFPEISNSKFEITQAAYTNIKVVASNKVLEHLGIKVIKL